MVSLFHHWFGKWCFRAACASFVGSFLFLFSWRKRNVSDFIDCWRFWKTPIGYLFAIGVEFYTFSWYLRYLGSFLSFGIVCLLNSLTLSKDAQVSLNSINEMAKTKQPRSFIVEKLNRFVDLLSQRGLNIYKFIFISTSLIYATTLNFFLLYSELSNMSQKYFKQRSPYCYWDALQQYAWHC